MTESRLPGGPPSGHPFDAPGRLMVGPGEFRKPGAPPPIGPVEFFQTANEALGILDGQISVIDRFGTQTTSPIHALRTRLANARATVLTLYRSAMERHAGRMAEGVDPMVEAVTSSYVAAFPPIVPPQSAPAVAPMETPR